MVGLTSKKDIIVFLSLLIEKRWRVLLLSHLKEREDHEMDFKMDDFPTSFKWERLLLLNGKDYGKRKIPSRRLTISVNK